MGKMLPVKSGPVSTRPLLSARLAAWQKAYEAVGAEIQAAATTQDYKPNQLPLTPGGLLDIATTAATVAASLVAGAELE
jgi:hypothetical protein